MAHFCKTCKHVRTAEEIGLAHETVGAWPAPLYCGRHVPPVFRDGRAAGLPSGGGYKNMSCFEPDDATFMLTLTEKEAEALHALFEWRADLLRTVPLASVARIDIGTIVERVNGALGYMRERGKWRS